MVREKYTRRCGRRRRRSRPPHLRNMGTLGGNLCLDTRCNYYNQNYEWRKAIDFCLKKDGEICWVATASKRCVAVSSTDTRARADRAGRERETGLRAGRARSCARRPLSKRRHRLPRAQARRDPHRGEAAAAEGWKSSYWKLRRRGSFDFPVLGVAAAVKIARDGTVEEARIALGAVASRPFLVEKAASCSIGKKLTDEAIAEAGGKVASRAKPMDNTDLDLYWRKDVVVELRRLRAARDARRRHARDAPAHRPPGALAARLLAQADPCGPAAPLLSGFWGKNISAMPRLYSRTDAGRRAWDSQDRLVPLDCRRVLGFVGKDTAPRDIREKLGWSEAAVDEILKELEEGGLIKSVQTGPDKSVLDFTGNFLVADIEAAQKRLREDLDFTGPLSADDLRAAREKK